MEKYFIRDNWDASENDCGVDFEVTLFEKIAKYPYERKRGSFICRYDANIFLKALTDDENKILVK